MSAKRTHNTARLPVRIPQELLDDLDRFCAEKRITRSAFVRKAIETQINRDRIHEKCLRTRAALDDLHKQWAC